MKRINQIKKIGVFLFFLTLFGCSTPKIQTRVELPAKIPEVSKVKKIGIYDLKNDTILIGAKLEELFRSVQTNNTPFFEVFNREDLERIIQEQNNASSVLFNEAQVINIGKLAKVEAILTGAVQTAILKQTPYTKTEFRLQCLVWKNLACQQWVPISYPVHCTKSQSSIAFQIRISDVENGQAILAKTYTGANSDDTCSTPPSLAQMQQQSIRQALANVRQDIAPYYISVTIELMEKDNSDLSDQKEAQEYFDLGLEFINADTPSIQKGCGYFHQAASRYGESAAIYYNLGVCTEIEGDINKAQSYYLQAEQKLKKPNNLVSKALQNIKKRKADEAALEKQKSIRE